MWCLLIRAGSWDYPDGLCLEEGGVSCALSRDVGLGYWIRLVPTISTRIISLCSDGTTSSQPYGTKETIPMYHNAITYNDRVWVRTWWNAEITYQPP